MRFRYLVLAVMCAALACGPVALPSYGQAAQGGGQNEATPVQRLEVMRQRLEAMRRQLNSAVAVLNANAKDSGSQKQAAADDPAARLRGLDKEVGTLLSEVAEIRNKQDRAERYDTSQLDKLETSVRDLNERVEAGLRSTVGERSAATLNPNAPPKKKSGGFFSKIFGGGDNDKYSELVGTVAPGRDRQLFEEATLQARKSRYETARDLYNVIITTYPESPFLPAAKLAIADTFYLEGTTSALIQAGSAYQDWLTFFPTHPLADDVMFKMAEVEMRRMGLPDREITPARKAEQRIKVLLQQFPDTPLREEAQKRLDEVQENLGMHSMLVGNFYFDRYSQGKAQSPKGAQSRYREIVEKYPRFSYMDEVLYRLGVTYVQEEEPDEATKYFQQLARNYPNSSYAEKAKEQLEAIGSPVPAADPQALSRVEPERPGFMSRTLTQITGSASITINKNGVLINKDEKGGDLIEEVLSNGGILPATTPTAPTTRRPPARPLDAPPASTTTKTGSAASQEPAKTPATQTADQTGAKP